MFSSGARCFQKCGSFKIPWKIGGHESGRKPCSQTPTYDTPAIAGKHSRDVGNSRDPSSNRNASFKPHKQEKAQPQQQKRHQHQDLCGKAMKVTGNEARNVAKNKKFGGR